MAEYIFSGVVEDEDDGWTSLGAAFRIQERIVRCRNCKNYRPTRDDEHEDGCALAYAYLFETSPDGFCAWGEER